MKKIFYLGALAAVAVGSLTSCDHNYLNTEPTTTVTTATVTSDTENLTRGVQGICRGMYGQYQDEPQFMSGEPIFMLYGEAQSNDYYSTFFKSWQWDDIMNMRFLNLDQYRTSDLMWMYAYTIIAQANDLLPSVEAAAGSEEEKQFIRASLLTLRAHGYWRLLQCYAPRWQDSDNGQKKCIVLRLDRNISSAPLASMGEVLDQMYVDMDEAIELYQQSGLKRTYKWEPDINVAYGVYARLALLKNDWQKAYDMSLKALEGYPLMSNDEEHGGFATANGEWLWGAVNMNPLYYFSYGIFYTCNGYQAYNGQYGGGGAINIDLYHQIPDSDTRKYWFLGDNADSPIEAKYWWNTDPDRKYTVASYGGMTDTSLTNARLKRSLLKWLNEHNPDPTVFANPYAVPEGIKVDNAQILYSLGAQLKFWCKGLGSVNVDLGDVCWMRAAEFYLTAAEAAAELGKTADAQRLLNDINKKRDPEYNCTASGQALIDEARLYRRIELWGEGFNWFDFKRWNMPIDRRAWVEGDVTSGNWPKEVAVKIEPNAYNGWVIEIPRAEKEYNDQL